MGAAIFCTLLCTLGVSLRNLTEIVHRSLMWTASVPTLQLILMDCGDLPRGFRAEGVGAMSRWGFCLKVFSIVGCQLVLTAVMAALIMFNKPVQNLVLTNLPLQVGPCIRLPSITMYNMCNTSPEDSYVFMCAHACSCVFDPLYYTDLAVNDLVT